jgi:hypothetical protein
MRAFWWWQNVPSRDPAMRPVRLRAVKLDFPEEVVYRFVSRFP